MFRPKPIMLLLVLLSTVNLHGILWAEAAEPREENQQSSEKKQDSSFYRSVMGLMDRPFALFDERPLDAFTTDPFESVRRNLHGVQQQFERFNRHVFDDPFFRHGPSRLLREGFFSDQKAEKGEGDMVTKEVPPMTKSTEDKASASDTASSRSSTLERVYKMQSMSSTRDGETISESRQQYWDGHTGYTKETNERTINDMGHRFVIEHDPKTKKDKRKDEYRGISKEKADEFEKLWQEGLTRHTEDLRSPSLLEGGSEDELARRRPSLDTTKDTGTGTSASASSPKTTGELQRKQVRLPMYPVMDHWHDIQRRTPVRKEGSRSGRRYSSPGSVSAPGTV